MKKQWTEVKAFPASENFSEIDRLMFGPVDPLAQTNKRLTLLLAVLGTSLAVSVIAIAGLVFYFQSRPVRVLSMNENGQVESFSLRLSGFNLHRTETQAALRNAVTAWAEKFYSRLRNPTSVRLSASTSTAS